MAIQKWSDEITIAELGDDPSFSDELITLIDESESAPRDVVLNLSAVSFVNSSNVARLLRLRKHLISADKRLMLCGMNTQVWGIFLVTGLDKVFTFTNDISTALATLQMGGAPSKR
jgi:anti-anti-sigma factor